MSHLVEEDMEALFIRAQDLTAGSSHVIWVGLKQTTSRYLSDDYFYIWFRLSSSVQTKGV